MSLTMLSRCYAQNNGQPSYAGRGSGCFVCSGWSHALKLVGGDSYPLVCPSLVYHVVPWWQVCQVACHDLSICFTWVSWYPKPSHLHVVKGDVGHPTHPHTHTTYTHITHTYTHHINITYTHTHGSWK